MGTILELLIDICGNLLVRLIGLVSLFVIFAYVFYLAIACINKIVNGLTTLVN